jgi:hypothetical protein
MTMILWLLYGTKEESTNTIIIEKSLVPYSIGKLLDHVMLSCSEFGGSPDHYIFKKIGYGYSFRPMGEITSPVYYDLFGDISQN